ncbi:type II secretion system F family protein [Eubacterium xylanophilum]|uniref:type II secretion system F family protein n=1 Tax=Eubacterium xylanophilum TaxID=39497 RepID=UPI001A9840EE|nr:type II secretion system F family protein [Eubacterium xylanophilum]
MIASVPLSLFLMNKNKSRLIDKRKWELDIQFRDALDAVVAALVAGYSLENSFASARESLSLMYDDDALIIREMDYIVNRVEYNVPIEQVLQEFSDRSNVEDIRMFCDVVGIAKRTGGNLVKIIRGTSGNIAERQESRREIETMISGKKMEANIMSIIPMSMIVYMRVFSPGYLDPMYHNLAGVVMMTVCLVLYGLGVFAARRIMTIEW